jgi:signal transduction histidine kinase
LSEVFVQDRVASEDVRRQYYTVLDRESGRLHRLVEGLLKFGDPRHDKFGTIDTAALLRSVVEEFSVEADRRGYRIELNAGDASLSVRADREALSCVVWNLLDNAVKYSPGNNTVWVELSRMNGHVAIRVRDEGAGIPRNDQRRIFKKFVRGATARTLGVPGTGIGLAVAHQIVKRHGGDIRLQSEPGKGSTFTVLLPLPPGEGVA